MNNDHDVTPGVNYPDSVLVLGTTISVTSYDEILTLAATPPTRRARVVTFCNVHSVMTSRRDPELRRALDNADVAAPDGMPLVWALRRSVRSDQPRVYGPDLMELALQHGVAHGWRHFLFGATDQTLDQLEARARQIAPGIEVVGRHAPPFRSMSHTEEREVLDQIRRSGADIVWVGLGMPKQELWMHRVRDELPGVTMMGVGAAFDLISGTVPQAPDWLQRRGLEWAYRLWREPRRLWRRYLVNNPAFLLLTAIERLRRQVGRS